ncbi:MAG TPA: helix-turn-helix transcriptional regulator [Dehalococcoidia bacterium]|nr:helix-turn-helix transcriptional regulator [Dehalococcoidia bacterium]
MPRPLGAPRFADTPGRWLACYRYRCHSEDGSPLSPEQLGSLLGVSGATVRRWEAGNSKPSEMDLRRFGDICGLSALELEFILVAFAAKNLEQPPTEEAFSHVMPDIISADFPAYAMDSLFYLRAWNSYMRVFLPFSEGQTPHHILAAHLTVHAPTEEPEAYEARIDYWIREFWLSTAGLCGSEPYRRVLAELRDVPEFEERWRRLGLEISNPKPNGGPYYFTTGRLGVFRVFPVRVNCPPVYHVREHVPLDAAALAHLDGERSSGPPSVNLAPDRHWAVERR